MTQKHCLKEFVKYVEACIDHGRWDDIYWQELCRRAKKSLKPRKKKKTS